MSVPNDPRVPAAPMDSTTHAPTLTAYIVGNPEGWVLEPASPRRRWMDEFADGFPYRCLPLSIANQCGWVVRCPVGFSICWYGGRNPIDIRLAFDHDTPRFSKEITSHFGGGILTFSLPWLFRTSPGLCLYVRGLPNSIKPGAHPLDAIVETQWAPMTFTMNWQLLDPTRTVRFEQGDALAMLLPISLPAIEATHTAIKPLDSDPALAAEYREWSEYRNGFIRRTDRAPEEWQKDYMAGRHVDGRTETDHKSRLKLRPFTTEPRA